MAERTDKELLDLLDALGRWSAHEHPLTFQNQQGAMPRYKFGVASFRKAANAVMDDAAMSHAPNASDGAVADLKRGLEIAGETEREAWGALGDVPREHLTLEEAISSVVRERDALRVAASRALENLDGIAAGDDIPSTAIRQLLRAALADGKG